MTKESLTENDSTVKNKKRTRRASHTVADGFAFTIREFTRGMVPDCVGKTRRGRLNNSAYHIKKTAMAWADSFPKKINGVPTGFTPAVREIFKALVWAHLMNRGYAVFSYESLADATLCHRDTVREAINFLSARGLIQFKTGKGWGREERRSLANQYTANFWAFMNPETGTIIKPEYHTGIYEWEMTAAVFRARIKEGPYTEIPPMVSKRGKGLPGVARKSEPYAEIPPMVRPKNRLTSARPYAEIPPLYSGNGKAASASATANAPSGAPASEETRSGKTLTGFANVGELMQATGFILQGFNFYLRGKRFSDQTERLGAFCQTLENNPPTNGVEYSRLVIHGDEGKAEFIEGNVSLSDLGPEDWLAVEYQPGPG